jgi:uncharacterized protein
MFPSSLPLFPLPNVVLFPGVYLPLHIFEPRYRTMAQDALDGDRLIGMVLLKPGFESDYDGRPPIYAVGCSGLITHHERLDDGRFNIVLQGLDRFRVLAEDSSRLYRVAEVERLAEPAVDDALAIRSLRQRLESLVTPLVERAGGEMTIPPAMSDVDLIHALAQYLDLEALEKQALLELDGLATRAAALVDLLEMKTLMSGRTASGRH